MHVGTQRRAMAGRLDAVDRAEADRDPPEVAALTTAIANVRICARNGAWNEAARATVLDQTKRAFTTPR